MRKEEAVVLGFFYSETWTGLAEVSPCCVCHVFALPDISVGVNMKKVGRLSAELLSGFSVL